MGGLFKALVVAADTAGARRLSSDSDMRVNDRPRSSPRRCSRARRARMPSSRGRAAFSTGVYATLNGGVGSRDEARRRVAENRAPHGGALGVAPDRLLVPYQVHSADCARRRRAVAQASGRAATARHRDARPRARRDRAPIAACSCSAMPKAGVIGAAHSGWKGALDGVLGATVARDGGPRRARARHYRVALGPTIGAGLV